MSDYIDVDFATVCDEWQPTVTSGEAQKMSDYKEIIVKEYHNDKGLLTRREVGEELIRCKNCMHNGSFDTDCPFGWKDKKFNMPNAYDYCSYGERKEQENE